MRDDEMVCPKCGEECWRDDVDVGVGTIYGPWGCGYCGWSEINREELQKEYPGYYIDPFGGATLIDGIVERAEYFGLNGDVVREAFQKKNDNPSILDQPQG